MARDALAAGAALECRDLNQMTPLMLAAQGAHGEVFAALVEAGGDLRATALGQTDLLECAAEGGDVGVIRFLLEKGLPIEGQWQPRSQAEKQLGHLTPLLMAAINGHVEAVQILLKAGANRKAEFDGQTAAQFMAAGRGNPNGDKEAALGARYAAIGELLQEKGTSGAFDVEAWAREELTRSEKNAEAKEAVAFRKRVEAVWGPAREGNRFQAKKVAEQSEIEKWQHEARRAGCHLVLEQPWAAGESAEFALLATANKFAVVAAMGTAGPNEAVSHADVLRWLYRVDQANPFLLVFCGADLIGGVFPEAVKGTTELAKAMVDVCPGVLDEDAGTVEALADWLKEHRSFLLRWS